MIIFDAQAYSIEQLQFNENSQKQNIYFEQKTFQSYTSYSGYKQNNDSTIIESFPDSTRILQMNISHYEDTLIQEVFISTAYEQILDVRDLIFNSRQSIKPLRESINQLRYQIQAIEYKQKEDYFNLEYDISQRINKIKQVEFNDLQKIINQYEVVIQNGEFTLSREQIKIL